jgi:hypothetical protein
MRFVLEIDLDGAAFDVPELYDEGTLTSTAEACLVLERVREDLERLTDLRVGDRGTAPDSQGLQCAAWRVAVGRP